MLRRLGRAYGVLGDAHVRLGALDEASKNYDKAVAIVSDIAIDLFPVLQLKRADVYIARQHFKEAQLVLAILFFFFCS
jgi:tetratricopeptide (TPR) repeat protein